jgi:hypothetical protein
MVFRAMATNKVRCQNSSEKKKKLTREELTIPLQRRVSLHKVTL